MLCITKGLHKISLHEATSKKYLVLALVTQQCSHRESESVGIYMYIIILLSSTEQFKHFGHTCPICHLSVDCV